MIVKQLAIATLFAAILLTVLFTPVAFQQGGGAYDPWLDHNEDGVIDVNDLHPLGGAYGTTGDSTKNVNVTNWPLQRPIWPERIRLRATAYELFSNISSTPSGAAFLGSSRYCLIGENTPYPNANIYNSSSLISAEPFPTAWTPGYPLTFIHEAYPQVGYQIRGDVSVNMKFSYYLTNYDLASNDTVYFNITVTLGKINSFGYESMVSETLYLSQRLLANSAENRDIPGSYDLVPGVILDLASPVMISAGERLYISIDTWARSAIGQTGGTLRLWYTVGTNEFLATIQTIGP